MWLFRALLIALVALAAAAPPRLHAIAGESAAAEAAHGAAHDAIASRSSDCHDEAPAPPQPHLIHQICIAACACLPAALSPPTSQLDSPFSRLAVAPDEQTPRRVAAEGPFRPPRSTS